MDKAQSIITLYTIFEPSYPTRKRYAYHKMKQYTKKNTKIFKTRIIRMNFIRLNKIPRVKTTPPPKRLVLTMATQKDPFTLPHTTL